MLCDCVAACGEGLHPTISYLLLDQLLEKDWIAFCLRPIALAAQQVCSFQFRGESQMHSAMKTI